MKQKMMKFHSADGPDYEVPVPQEKYKAIGWVVECPGKCYYSDTFRRTRKEAISMYPEQLYWLDKKAGIARCVRVYVEVK